MTVQRYIPGVKKPDGYLQPFMSPNPQGGYVSFEDYDQLQRDLDRLLGAVKKLRSGPLDTQTGVAGRDDATRASVLWERVHIAAEEMRDLYKLAEELEAGHREKEEG